MGLGWGRGAQDPVTGAFAYYEWPLSHPNHPDNAGRLYFTWREVFAQWNAIAFDFHRMLNVNIRRVWADDSETWDWFLPLVTTLVSHPDAVLRQRLTAARERADKLAAERLTEEGFTSEP